MPRFDRRAFDRDLRTRHLGRDVQYRLRTTSTMDDARRAAERGGPHGFLVLAEEQTAGRGRLRGRQWISAAYQNLSFTLVLRPDPARAARLSICAPVAVANAVEQLTGLFPRIKWPNDLRLGGRKFAGILIEGGWRDGRPDYALVGIGINVNFDPSLQGGLAGPATSLAAARGRPLVREALLAAVCSAFERAYDGALSEALFEGWRSRSETLGRPVTVAFDDGRRLDGIAAGVSPDGALLLRTADGALHELHAGEVSLRAEPSPSPSPA